MVRTTPVASTAMHLAPATLAPAFVATARTTALATSDSRHHALAPGAVRRTQDTGTSPATKRQSPPANGKNRGQPSSTGSPSPDEVVADGFMRMDLGQAKHATVQTCEVPYPQVLPVVETTKSAAAQDQTMGAYDRTPLPTEGRYLPTSAEDFVWRPAPKKRQLLMFGKTPIRAFQSVGLCQSDHTLCTDWNL